jgi:geranylgeranyl pyrophosphate synthase
MATNEAVAQRILSVHRVSDWPEVARSVERYVADQDGTIWHYPLLACESFGGTQDQAYSCMASVACLVLSILLVDDMLDNDARGMHVRLGMPVTANIAVFLQSVAGELITDLDWDPKLKLEVCRMLARASASTAYGQSLDITDLPRSENDYWKTCEAKSSDLFKYALFAGALAGGAGLGPAKTISELSAPLARFIQVSDDLADVFYDPVHPDWERPWSNIALVYALTADHPERQPLMELLADIRGGSNVEKARQIVINCGGLAYSVYHLMREYRNLRERLGKAALPNPAPLEKFLDRLMAPTQSLFASVGHELSTDSILKMLENA